MRLLLPLLLAGCAAEAGWGETRNPSLRGYVADPSWPRKPADIVWGQMPGVAVDADDRVWIFTRREPVVQVYDARTGTLKARWDRIPYGNAHHIRIGPEGNIWLADIGLHTVHKFSPDGNLLLTLGTSGEAGEDETHLNKPTDMAVTPAGDVFVSDGYGNNRVVHFDKTGKFVKAWGRKGHGEGEFDLPHGIGVDSKGRLYVADRSNARIQVFDQDGTFLAQWRHLLVPWSIWVTKDDEIWTCGSTPTRGVNDQHMTGIPPHDQVLMRLDAAGKVLEIWSPPPGRGPGELAWVHSVAVDSEGNLYAGDIQGMRVQKFVRVP